MTPIRDEKDSRASLILLGFAVFLTLAVTVVALLFLRSTYNSAVADGKAEVDRFINGAQRAVGLNLLGVDMLLGSTGRLLDLAHTHPQALDVLRSSQLIASTTHPNLLIRNVALLDAQGNTVVSSDLDGLGNTMVLPKGFAEQVLTQPVSTMLASAPMSSFSSGGQVLFCARYARLADGSKVLVVAEIKLHILVPIMMQGADPTRIEATLEHANGTILASAPGQRTLADAAQRLELPVSVNFTFDTYLPQEPVQFMPARLSGRPALVAARGLLHNDVALTASIPMEKVLQGWYEQRRLILATAIIFIIMIVITTVLGLMYLRRRGRAQRTLTEAKSALDQALESMDNGFLLLDEQLRVVRWNRRYLELFPWLANTIATGNPVQSLLHSSAQVCQPNASDAERHAWQTQELDRLLQPTLSAHEHNLPQGVVIEITERRTADGGLVILFQDVTALRQASAEVTQLAYFDPLTDLPNRRLLGDRLTQAILASQRNDQHGALLFLDLDHFKTLNDTMGHDLGDALLRQAAERLKRCVRETDTIARLGGDEFVVMLLNLHTDPTEAALQTKAVGEKILYSLNLPYELQGISHRSSCSIGATLFSNASFVAADLLKQADIAMYQAKASGRNAQCFFDPSMLNSIETRAELERDLRAALAHEQFALYYQVQVTSQSVAVGAEVLVRWHHPARGFLSPLEFIAMAEETGLILPLGDWVLRTACEQLKQWESQALLNQLELSVNVSARQFYQPDFVERVSAVICSTDINPALLKLELTESLVLNDVPDTIAKMHQLKALGVRFSMDDFGTGHSSLSYLTRLPLDQLKIDKSFLQNIGTHKANATIVQTIIGMGTNLGLEVIAEGVETTDQRDFLAAHGCHLYQGYLYSQPVPVEAFEALVQNMAA